MIFNLHDNQLVFSIKGYQGRPYMHLKAYVMWCHDDVRMELLAEVGLIWRTPWMGLNERSLVSLRTRFWQELQVKISTTKVEVPTDKRKPSMEHCMGLIERTPRKNKYWTGRATYREGRTQYKILFREHQVQLSTRQVGVLTYDWKFCTKELWKD
jgi:hypothetical protein